jgi:lipopolysaccharide export system protein LptA
MSKFSLLLTCFFIFFESIYSQSEDEKITVIGDSLVGKFVEGESVREVIGNVKLSQGNVFVTCNKAIQYLARNEAELIGNVVATQDSLTLKTEKGFYFGNLRKTKSTSGIILDDTEVVLSADSGEYFFNDARAFFQTNVRLLDSTTALSADELTYFKNLDKSIAVGNVNIIDKDNIITADTLTHLRQAKYSLADGNVSIKNLRDNLTIFGNHLEDDGQLKYTLINKKPILMQVDTTFNTDEVDENRISIDTLLIKSNVMESFRSGTNVFKATDSVKILRGGFASVNDLTTYYRDEEKIITKKIREDASRPVLWYENSQLMGDSVTIYLLNGQIEELVVNLNAFMLSQNKIFDRRFDQTSSDSVHLYFASDRLQRAEFAGKVQSIYYLYDDDTPNGLVKSTAHKAVIVFVRNEIDQVRLFGSPTSEYHPEAKVEGLERTFTLPKFVLKENRPLKKDFLMNQQKADE